MIYESANRSRDADLFLRAFMRRARALYDRLAPGIFARFPNSGRPCVSCALNPETDAWEGWDSTAFGLMQAVEHCQPFLCHKARLVSGQYVPKQRLCAGFSVLLADLPAARRAICEAAIDAAQGDKER